MNEETTPGPEATAEVAAGATAENDPDAVAGVPTAAPERAETDWRRRRRLAEIFGDTLPETTSDERDRTRSAHPDGESATDRWLKSQVPPHHGG